MSRSWIVGAYAASPSGVGWDPALEARFFEGLRALPGIGGLEIPFFGSLHRHDDGWLPGQLRADWKLVLTMIPGVMNRLAEEPHFGLASDDESGRRAALEYAEAARRAVLAANRALGHKAVIGVEVHSAPQLGRDGVRSSPESLARSLSELRDRDWDGAGLWIEHCDRYRPGQRPAKGFLAIEDEVAAIAESSGQVEAGIVVNWGRSAIEERDAGAPHAHLRAARRAGLLRGLIFSGVAVEDPLYGDWADSHAPFERTLLGAAETRQCLAEAVEADAPCIGLKMQTLPRELDVEQRLALLRGYVDYLTEARRAMDPG